MSYAEHRDRARRLCVLQRLAAQRDGRLNDRDVQSELELFGHRCTRDEVRALLEWLDHAGCVRVSFPLHAVMVAEITGRGQDHVDRRGPPVEGIDEPPRR